MDRPDDDRDACPQCLREWRACDCDDRSRDDRERDVLDAEAP